MRAVITVIGKDNVGIVAKVSTVCANSNANIIDVTQTIMEDLFTMIMLVDLEKLNSEFDILRDSLEKMGQENNLQIHIMHEDIFNAMHRI